jgi:hypothetical protein
MTFMRLRAECMEMRRQVFFDIIAVDKKTKSLTSLLVKIQKFRTSLEERYLPWLDSSVPLHNLARLVFELGTRSLHLQTLHRYLFNLKQQMPDRLRQVLIEAGLAQMESAIALETTPSLQPWVWYKGAFNQYHSALLLLVEVCNYPMRKDAPRIWACLDYIFEIPPHLAPKEKAELVVSDLAARMTVYQNMRKLKAPTLMEERLGTGSKSSLRINPSAASGGSAATAAALQNMDGVIDASGQMFQKQATMPMGFSPPPPSMKDEADASGSQNGDNNPLLPRGPGAGFEAVMQDIDWNELNKFYSETGELNVTNYDMSEFTTGVGAGAVGSVGGGFGGLMGGDAGGFSMAGGPLTGLTVPSNSHLSDIGGGGGGGGGGAAGGGGGGYPNSLLFSPQQQQQQQQQDEKTAFLYRNS